MARGRRNSTSSLDRPVSPVSTSDSTTTTNEDGVNLRYAPSTATPPDPSENPFQDPSVSSTSLPENPFEPQEPSRPTQPSHPRNSIRKSLGQRQDRSSTDRNRMTLTPHFNPSQSHTPRNPSTSSSASYAPSQDPFSDDNGPSHAYDMYHQGTGLSRSTSLTPSSIQRSSSTRSTRSRQGPTHPYNLYPQDVSAVTAAPQTQIPVGFPGHLQQYHRRIGADGEEQGLVGADGHAEQLPPYSRYPDESQGKTVAFGPMPTAYERPHAEDNAQEEEENPRRESEPQNVASEDRAESPAPPQASEDSTTLVTSEKPVDSKRWKEQTWKERSKTRLCGFIPIWFILLALAVVAIIVIVCASVISTFFHHEKKKYTPKEDPEAAHLSSTTTTWTATYYDAVPTQAPVIPPPIGRFIVPLGGHDMLFNECLGTEQLNAWNCQLTLGQSLCVDISSQTDPERAFFNTCNNQSRLEYGTQPPILVQQTLKLVTDLDSQNLGPAWHFQTFYDKLVVIPAKDLRDGYQWPERDVGTSQSDSDAAEVALEKRHYSRNEVKPYEKAWFCHWDDTFIEGFIYATVSNPRPSPTPTVSSTVSVKTPTSYPPSLYTNTMATASSFPSEYYGADNPIVSPTWVSFGYESVDLEVRDSDSHDTLSPEPLSSTAGPTETPSSISSMTHTPVPTTMTAPSNTTASTYSAPTPSVIPQFVKFEERRLKGLHDTAICNLMKRVPDLTFKQVFDKWGKAVTVTLNEDDGPNALKNKMKRSPFYTTGGGAALEKRQSRYVPSEVNETCFCQWTSETFD